jgi:hypothetical protein
MATDLERLIVSIEANTKQFERAMRSLERTTDQAMGGVERSMRRSLAQQESLFGSFGNRIGTKFVNSLSKVFLAYFGVQFIKDSVGLSAKAGDASGKALYDSMTYWTELLSLKVGHDFGEMFKNTFEKELPAISRYLSQTAIGQILGVTPKTLEFEVRPPPGWHPVGYKPPTVAAPKLGPLQAPGAEQLEAFDKVMKDLIFEEKQLGRTAEMQMVYNELKKAGVNIESEYGQAIQITAQRLHQEELQLQALKEANDGLEASTKTFIQGLLDGQSAAESFSAALRKMADVLLDMALHNLFNPGGTPLLQNLFGSALGLGQWTGGKLPGSVPGAQYGAHFQVGGTGGTDSQLVAFRATPGETVHVGNSALGPSGRGGGDLVLHQSTSINVAGSVDQRTLAAMNGMIQRNNVRQNAELQRTWGNRQARYSALRGP